VLAVTAQAGNLLRFDPASGWSPVLPTSVPGSRRAPGRRTLLCTVAGGAVLRARDGIAELIDVKSGVTRWRDPSEGVVAGAMGPTLAATASVRGDVRVADVATGAEVRTLHLGQRIPAVALLGERLVTISTAEVGIWNARTGEKLFTLPGTAVPRDLMTLPVAPRAGLFLVPSADREAEIRDVADGALIAALQGQRGAVHGGAFSDDGHLVATRHMDEVVATLGRADRCPARRAELRAAGRRGLRARRRRAHDRRRCRRAAGLAAGAGPPIGRRDPSLRRELRALPASSGASWRRRLSKDDRVGKVSHSPLSFDASPCSCSCAGPPRPSDPRSAPAGCVLGALSSD
jgi:hypothetical protein